MNDAGAPYEVARDAPGMKAGWIGRPGGWMAGLFILVVMMLASGCQAASAPQATRTPILLPAQGETPPAEAAQQPATTPPAPALTPAARVPAAAPVTPEAVSVSASEESLMALGLRATVTLYAQPAPDASVVARVPGSQVLWAQGRNATGDWLWVAYSGARSTGPYAWVAAREVKTIGDIQGLPEAQPDRNVGTPPEEAAAAAAPNAPPRAAAAERLPGKIAFHTATGGQIYLINADGSGLRRLTDGFDPALSPDGTRLAFVRWGAPDGLYLLDLRTGEERRLTSAQRPRGPAWRPDGAAIVFSHQTQEATCLSTPFGCLSSSEVQAIFHGQDCIDTQAGRLCVSSFSMIRIELTGLAQVAADGSNWLDLPTQRRSQAPSWRPQDNSLLYTGDAGLQVLKSDAETQPFLNNVALKNASWAPDGQRIVAQIRQHDRWEIVLLDAGGTIVSQLTSPAQRDTPGANNVAPAWAPDGRSILFLSDRDGRWRIYRMNPDGSGQAPFLPQALSDVTLDYDFGADRVISWSP